MADITTVWDQTNGDWAMAGADLLAGDDLTTAVLISLFTDQTATPDDPVLDASGDPRGWWGDLGADQPIGSKLWLYDRSKQTSAVLAGVRDAARQALQWLIDDGVAQAVQVFAAWIQGGFLGLQVIITQANGQNATLSFQTAWQGVA
jgi:phage gp46-like protein